jgi:glycosyltransferase involved in cell wall biosynthesis
MTRPKALLLTKYTAQAASSRYRAYQYLAALEAAGFACTACPLLSDAYLRRTYAGGSRGRRLAWMMPRVLQSMARRWWWLLRGARAFDVVYLQYEVFPYAPLWLDQVLFRRNPRVVIDFDDAVNTRYELHASPLVRRVLGGKLAALVRQSRHVITGNRLLASWAGRFNPNVTVIPTSVNLSRYPPAGPRRPDGGRPVIGWIGTPYTQRYLPLLADPLRALRARHDFVFKVIGAPAFTMDGIDVQAVPWQEASEVAELQSCDVGVMPLPDEPFERGKSALKLIQYFAAGLPAVVSPVGVNAEIIRDGENGFLAETPRQWADKLALLLERPDDRARLGQAGRRTAAENFSVEVNGPRLAEVLARVARAGGNNR